MLECGLTLRSIDLPPSKFAELAKVAEDLGFGRITLTEELARSSIPSISLALHSSKRIKVGSSILNIFGRTPLTISMEALTLSEIAPGRFELGLGTGGPGIVEKGHGMRFERPVDRMREYLTIIRSYVKDGRASHKGGFFNVDARLWVRPYAEGPLPLYVAALNPLMLRLAGELADGVIFNMLSLHAFEALKRYVTEGLDKKGRSLSDFKLMAMLLCGVGDDESAKLELRRGVAFYFAAPTYRFLIERSKIAGEALKVGEAWASGKRDYAIQLVTDEMLEEFTLGWRPDEIVTKAEEFSKRGVYPLLYLHPAKDRSFKDYVNFLNDIARA